MDRATLTMDLLAAPPLRKHEQPGDVIEGVLVSYERGKLGDGFGIKYTFEEPNGDRFSMWGTNDMNQVIRLPYHKGHFIKMTFVGNDTNSKAGQSARKVIEVRASREVLADFSVIDDEPF